MKLKLMIALVVLALFFGMILTACDDGDLSQILVGQNESIIERDDNLVPYIDANNTLQGNYGDTTGNSTTGVSIPDPKYVTPPRR